MKYAETQCGSRGVVVALVAVFAVGAPARARAQGSFQAALNTDTAGLNDKSFNHLGNLGR